MFPPVPASSAIVADLLPVLGSPTSKPLQLSIPPCTLDQSTIVAERTQLCNLWTAVPTREVKEVAVIIEGDPRARRRHAVGHGCGDRRERDRRNAHLLRYRAESLVMPITRQSG